jgi:hypothetical protein
MHRLPLQNRDLPIWQNGWTVGRRTVVSLLSAQRKHQEMMIMIRYTDDTLDAIDSAHSEYARFVPSHLMFGVEHDVEQEDHEYVEAVEADIDLMQHVAYAVRMAL